MTRIEKFTIERFRQFEKETKLQLDPVTVLIGANNSGKTAVLQAIVVFQYCLEKCLTRNNKNSGAATWHLKKTENVRPDEFGALPVASPTDLWPQGRPKPGQGIRLSATFEGGGSISFEIKLQFNLFNVRPTVEGVDDLDALLSSFGIRLIPVFSGLLPREEFLVLPARKERQQALRYGEIVRNLLHSLKTEAPQRFKLLIDLLHRLYPDVHVDVNYDEELARRIASARIASEYRDSVLTQHLDLIVGGSGLHQAVQIFAGMLQPGISMVLLDEPDAHFHARLQSTLMRILTELAEREGLQMVIATHSPQILRAAPPSSLRVCRDNSLIPFNPGPDQLELLEHLGVFERMELLPLLQSRRVAFVENRDDRELIEIFLQKQLGAKTEDLMRRITFLHTYQEPVSAGVLAKARQVNDILKDPSLSALGLSGNASFVAVGDRDYRTEAEMKREELTHSRKAKQQGYGFDFRLFLWRRAEIENYLLDIDAMTRAVAETATKLGLKTSWRKLRPEFRKFVLSQIGEQRDAITERFAARIQDRDRGLNLTTAMGRARQTLSSEWGDGTAWCDAKVVLSSARQFLQEHGLPAQALSHSNILQAMSEIPDDMKSLIRALTRLAGAATKKPQQGQQQPRARRKP